MVEYTRKDTKNMRGGIEELREAQLIANSKTEKVYSGYPKTKEEWIKVLDTWWDPEIREIIYQYGQTELSLHSDELYKLKDYPALHRLFETVWSDAPDSIEIHENPGWGVLCDLCSESYLLDNE